MKVLIFGGRGMLGHKVWQVFRDRFECWATIRGAGVPSSQRETFPPSRTIPGIDVTDATSIERALEASSPDVVINCVGVVKQLDAAADPVVSIGINSLFPHRLARATRARGARLLHVSTDCVFSGRTGGYGEDDLSDADDLYGRSKRLGEVTGPGCLTLRTSIIGRELAGAHGLVEWFLSARGGRVKGFRRAVFSGVTTAVLADLLASVVERHPSLGGLYHVAADPIDKDALLRLLNAAYDAGVTVAASDEPVIDRSLDAARFRRDTGWSAPSWRDMVDGLAADATPYDQWRQG